MASTLKIIESISKKKVLNFRYFRKLGIKLIVFGAELCQSFCYDLNGNI